MKRSILLALLPILLASGAVQPTMAQSQTRVCIGDRANDCPVQVDAFYGNCQHDLSSAAAEICTIYRDGRKETSAFRLLEQGRQGGGRCGYAWGMVTCVD